MTGQRNTCATSLSQVASVAGGLEALELRAAPSDLPRRGQGPRGSELLSQCFFGSFLLLFYGADTAWRRGLLRFMWCMIL